MPNSKIGPPTFPSVLAQVPKAVIRALDITSVLQSTLAAATPPVDSGPIVALNSVDSYLGAAKFQQRRIARARTAACRGIRPRRKIHENLFNDIHFYLICWARIAKLGRFITNKTRFKRAGLVLRLYHAELKDRVDCRDHLEHFEERLPGGIRQNKLLVPGDLLNMINENVTYGGRKLDIGPNSIRLLQTIVDEFRTAILFYAVEFLSTANPERLSDLLQRALSDIQIAKVTRDFQNNWRHQN